MSLAGRILDALERLMPDPEDFSPTELWVINFWILCLGILALLVLTR